MWRFESIHSFGAVGNLYQKMHFAGSNPATDPKCPKCIYKISKNFRVEKSGEISRNLRFSRFFVPASKSDTHHEVTEADTYPYKIIDYPGGLYAVAVSVDGDSESHDRVMKKIEQWLENTNFTIDSGRAFMGNMIYVDDEIKEGLGYHQMNLYTPIKLKK